MGEGGKGGGGGGGGGEEWRENNYGIGSQRENGTRES